MKKTLLKLYKIMLYIFAIAIILCISYGIISNCSSLKFNIKSSMETEETEKENKCKCSCELKTEGEKR